MADQSDDGARRPASQPQADESAVQPVPSGQPETGQPPATAGGDTLSLPAAAPGEQPADASAVASPPAVAGSPVQPLAPTAAAPANPAPGAAPANLAAGAAPVTPASEAAANPAVAAPGAPVGPAATGAWARLSSQPPRRPALPALRLREQPQGGAHRPSLLPTGRVPP